MLILTIPEMATSTYGWSRIAKARPPLAWVLTTLVVPLSLIPPLMLYYAGSHYGDEFVAGYGAKPWGAIAVAFFVAEMLTVAAMGAFIKQVAAGYRVAISLSDAYLLAGIAPVPLWLSALGLFVPSLAFNAALSLLALAAACGLIYHGVFALCRMRDELNAAGITQTVMGGGLAAWAVLLVAIVAA